MCLHLRFRKEADHHLLLGQNLTSKDILLGVRDRLPKYMLPNKMFFLENMPHNANGKIDKKMLQKIYENEMQK